jgi:hypothetical protein
MFDKYKTEAAKLHTMPKPDYYSYTFKLHNQAVVYTDNNMSVTIDIDGNVKRIESVELVSVMPIENFTEKAPLCPNAYAKAMKTLMEQIDYVEQREKVDNILKELESCTI